MLMSHEVIFKLIYTLIAFRELISTCAENQQVIIFVHTRKETFNTAKQMIVLAQMQHKLS